MSATRRAWGPASVRPGAPARLPAFARALPVAAPHTSRAGQARVGPILALPRVLAELSVPPERAFARARVDAHVFDDAEKRISYAALGRLAAVSAELSGCDHFGLLVGERFTLAGFGALGELMRNAPTVGEALRILLLHLYLHDRMAVPFLVRPHAGEALFGYSIHQRGVEATRFIYDGAIAIEYRILQELCGPRFRARRVELMRSAPHDRGAYRRVYGTAVRFNAEIAGVCFDAAWLDRRIEGADAGAYGVLAKALHAQRVAHPMRFAEEVLCVLHRLVLTGAVSAASVAHLFGIGERALRHRLRAEGTSIGTLLRETRRALAQQLLHDSRLPLSDVAAVLAYADLASFSRAFRSWTGESPRQWRAGHAARPGRAFRR